MNFLLILIVIVIIIVVYKLRKKSLNMGKTEIYQLNNFSKETYQKYLKFYSPIVITNYLIEFPSFETLCFEVLKGIDKNVQVSSKNKLTLKNERKWINLKTYIDSINNTDNVLYDNYSFFKQYTFEKIIDNYSSLMLTSNPRYCLNIFPNNFNSPITKNTMDKLIFLIYDGEININLINIYNKYNSKLNNLKNFKLNGFPIIFENSIKLNLNEISIIGRPGKIIIIPKGWWYYIETKKPSILVKLH